MRRKDQKANQRDETKGESQGGERRGLIDGDKLNQKWKGLA